MDEQALAARYTTQEKLLLAQCVHKHGAATWPVISKLVLGHPVCEGRPGELFTPEAIEGAYVGMMTGIGINVPVEGGTKPNAAPHLRLAQTFYVARMNELRASITEYEARFVTLVDEVKSVKAGAFDESIKADLRAVLERKYGRKVMSQWAPTEGQVREALAAGPLADGEEEKATAAAAAVQTTEPVDGTEEVAEEAAARAEPSGEKDKEQEADVVMDGAEKAASQAPAPPSPKVASSPVAETAKPPSRPAKDTRRSSRHDALVKEKDEAAPLAEPSTPANATSTNSRPKRGTAGAVASADAAKEAISAPPAVAAPEAEVEAEAEAGPEGAKSPVAAPAAQPPRPLPKRGARASSPPLSAKRPDSARSTRARDKVESAEPAAEGENKAPVKDKKAVVEVQEKEEEVAEEVKETEPENVEGVDEAEPVTATTADTEPEIETTDKSKHAVVGRREPSSRRKGVESKAAERDAPAEKVDIQETRPRHSTRKSAAAHEEAEDHAEEEEDEAKKVAPPSEPVTRSLRRSGRPSDPTRSEAESSKSPVKASARDRSVKAKEDKLEAEPVSARHATRSRSERQSSRAESTASKRDPSPVKRMSPQKTKATKTASPGSELSELSDLEGAEQGATTGIEEDAEGEANAEEDAPTTRSGKRKAAQAPSGAPGSKRKTAGRRASPAPTVETVPESEAGQESDAEPAADEEDSGRPRRHPARSVPSLSAAGAAVRGGRTRGSPASHRTRETSASASRRAASVASTGSASAQTPRGENAKDAEPQKKRRGRPPKNPDASEEKKPVGRPRKAKEPSVEEVEEAPRSTRDRGKAKVVDEDDEDGEEGRRRSSRRGRGVNPNLEDEPDTPGPGTRGRGAPSRRESMRLLSGVRVGGEGAGWDGNGHEQGVEAAMNEIRAESKTGTEQQKAGPRRATRGGGAGGPMDANVAGDVDVFGGHSAAASSSAAASGSQQDSRRAADKAKGKGPSRVLGASGSAHALPYVPAAAPPLRSRSDTKEAKTMRKLLLSLLETISEHKNGIVFQHPVRESKAPGYYNAVLRPMDLRTMRQRVREGHIVDIDEFERDLTLMFA